MGFDRIPVWKEGAYRRPQEIDQDTVTHLPTLIVGGGPIGMAMALDLAQRGHSITLVTAMPFIAAGSKAICFSKRTLDIAQRLGIAERMLEKGVVWDTGKVFWRDGVEPIYQFDLQPQKEQRNPAFINLQQYYVEEFLLEALNELPNVDIRWHQKVVDLEQLNDGVQVTIECPDGQYALKADYLLACDGCNSGVRQLMGLDFEGRVFEDNFLIADVRFKEERPAERWFRFDPPYPGWSSLSHKQPDGVWRLDFQLGWDIDKSEAVKPENVDPFVKGFLGQDVEFEYEWISVYTFQCRRMERFVHGRVIFAGDSAHLVSPFGARGCNGGFADIDNLGWKIDRVLKGFSPAKLLETYNDEAVATADENIQFSSRSTDFLTPKTAVSRAFRDSVLCLSKTYEFARPFVNSGRLSTPVSYPDSSLNSVGDSFSGGPAPGSPCVDAPLGPDQWLLSQLGGGFVAMVFGIPASDELRGWARANHVAILVVPRDATVAWNRYATDVGNVYLIRPDQYVAGRWNGESVSNISAAWNRACGV